MNGIENQLSVLDEQLESYEPLKRWLIYLSIGIGMIIISWVFFAAERFNELKTVQIQSDAIEVEINENSPESYQRKIARLNQTVREKERSVADLKSEKEALSVQMSHSKGLVFDNRHYPDTLDRLLKRPLELGLNIKSIHSDDTNEVFYGRVKKFKTLTIKGDGKFPSIAAFLSFIEEQETLIQINNVTIRSDEKNPSFEVKIVYMGAVL